MNSSNNRSVPRIDLSQFADEVDEIPERVLPSADSASKGLPKPKCGEPYLGTIPMGWVTRATALPGHAWTLFTAIWFQSSCAKGEPVFLSVRTREWFNLTNRKSYYRALATLVEAGLVRVEGHRGRRPLLTLVLTSPSSRRPRKKQGGSPEQNGHEPRRRSRRSRGGRKPA
jgi:hypothetical protein